jgi:hypothetical protein
LAGRFRGVSGKERAISNKAVKTSEPGRQAMPRWASVLTVLGWLIVVLAAVGLILGVIGVSDQPAVEAVIIVGNASKAIVTAGIGLLLVIVGRSRRTDAISSGLKLWAKLMIAIGAILGLGVAPYLGVLVFFYMEFTHDPTSGPLEVFDLTERVAMTAGIPFLVGAAIIASAIIWGRRKPPPNISDIFR